VRLAGQARFKAAGVCFSTKAGIQLNPIPYKGLAEIMQAILGGDIHVSQDT
jgi:tripartite-type tricarboxylate transporter receptor subunit TctC